MNNNSLLSLLLFQEVFDGKIQTIPFLLIGLVASPFLIVGYSAYCILKPKRKKFPEELADEALIERYRKGEDVSMWELRRAEARIYHGYYNLEAIDKGVPGRLR